MILALFEKSANLANSDKLAIGHSYPFKVMNSIFHDYSTLQKVVDIRYECRNQIYLVHIGPKRSNLAKKGSSTMVNLIVYWFSQFLGKIITFLTLITNFLAWNFLVIENFAWNFTRGPYIAFLWVPRGSELTWIRSKLWCKSVEMQLIHNFTKLQSSHFRFWPF